MQCRTGKSSPPRLGLLLNVLAAIMKHVNEVEPRQLPSSAEEGWMRGQEDVAKPPCSAQTGAKRERDSAKQEKVVLV